MAAVLDSRMPVMLGNLLMGVPPSCLLAMYEEILLCITS